MDPIRLLVVCTANQCRSPMAEAFAADRAYHLGVSLLTASAGTRATDGVPATDDATLTMRRLGLDISAHRSRLVTTEMATTADLVVAMERHHVLDLVNLHGAPMTRTYTVLELEAVTAATQRAPDETVDDYLERIAADRSAADVMRAPDLADPVGRTLRRHRRTAGVLREAVDRILDGVAGVNPSPGATDR